MSAAEKSNDSTTQPDPASVRLEPTVNDVDPISGASVSPNSIEGLFLRALRLETPAERDVLIRDACGNDLERIQRVTALLRAYEDAGSFLEIPVGGLRANQESALSVLLPSDKEGVLGTIGPYEVLDEIGRGGMGVVMRAVDPKLNRVVAIKALLPELAANPNSRRRFLREAQAAAAISHPHVVAIHAVDDAHQDVAGKPVPPYLVMECVIGQSLQQKLDRIGPLRLAEILRISRQIGEGLAAAHKQGVIHRDIKPANILLENGVERVKITDFGLARVIDDMTVTRTGEVCGTPQYMSPEQASGERVDQRSDLFSLGCVMYAMCTGHSPFRGDSIAHVIKRVTQDTPRPIADQNPEIPSWLTDIINSLLQKNAEHRFQSADGLVAILEQHLSRIQHPTESGSHSAINQQVPSTHAAATGTNPPNPASENVSMQFGSTIVSVPLANAVHYTAVKSFGRAWILLTFVGVILSLVMHPTLSLAANTAQMLSQALQIPAFLFGTWIMGMLGTKIFRPNQVPMRTYVLTSSSMLACMAFGYFWATVVRMPFSGNLNEISSRTLMGVAILPTIISLMYCGYVFREITKNPESLQGLQNLTGRNARLSPRNLLVLVVSVLMVSGLVGLLFTYGVPSTVDKQGNVTKTRPARGSVDTQVTPSSVPTTATSYPEKTKVERLLQLAREQEAKGLFEGALDLVNQALQLDPNSPSATSRKSHLEKITTRI